MSLPAPNLANGSSYVTRYMTEGQVFYSQDTSLLLYRVRQLTKAEPASTASDITSLPAITDLQLLDPSGAYLLQATIEIVDGNSQELRDRATRQLSGIRDSLKSEITLTQPDRLALDTRIPIPVRRV